MKIDAIVGDRNMSLSVADRDQLDIIAIDEHRYHVLYNEQSVHVKVKSVDIELDLVEVEINNTLYRIKILDELDHIVQSMGYGLNSYKGDDLIVAPMPGIVLDILVEDGQQVEKGQAMVILEAMKMENVLKAVRSGVIGHIFVSQGDTVDKQAPLIQMGT